MFEKILPIPIWGQQYRMKEPGEIGEVLEGSKSEIVSRLII
jgi:hypothetical protein